MTRQNPMLGLEVRGVDEVAKALKGAAKEIEKAFAVGLVSGALIVNNAAKGRAPYKTGNLKRSLHIGVGDKHGQVRNNVTDPEQSDGAPVTTRPGALEEIAGELAAKGEAVVTVGTNVEYAEQQEYLSERLGGGTHGTNKGPYLRPAIDDNHAEVRREVAEATAEAMRRLGA